MERDEFERRLRAGLLPYRRCTDPACPDAFAYRAPFPDADHYHAEPGAPASRESDPASPESES